MPFRNLSRETPSLALQHKVPNAPVPSSTSPGPPVRFAGSVQTHVTEDHLVGDRWAALVCVKPHVRRDSSSADRVVMHREPCTDCVPGEAALASAEPVVSVVSAAPRRFWEVSRSRAVVIACARFPSAVVASICGPIDGLLAVICEAAARPFHDARRRADAPRRPRQSVDRHPRSPSHDGLPPTHQVADPTSTASRRHSYSSARSCESCRRRFEAAAPSPLAA